MLKMRYRKLASEHRAQILTMMVEGVSIRVISRMTGASKNTIVKLLADAGEACAAYQDQAFRNLACKPALGETRLRFSERMLKR